MALVTRSASEILIENAGYQGNVIGAGPALCLLDSAIVHLDADGADLPEGALVLQGGGLGAAKDLEGKTEEEKEMIKLMGFANFDSSKGKHIPGNNVGAVHVIHKRKYRQYMNRKGGFNRPLDFVA
ncbi:hypothetical protein HPB52_003307 [Rhipicephalus sanguineus]|uniref:U4/U6.U5 small nuclear ribonucleoprotein 27 kDa protein n=1 Tax=Rhipicephalus sanguineus TaxID=34632 RepID=A0A9D4QH48_RHISA|nr:hypothetical protein HPB52_003307 [Rhipicephalus sanguineus]